MVFDSTFDQVTGAGGLPHRPQYPEAPLRPPLATGPTGGEKATLDMRATHTATLRSWEGWECHHQVSRILHGIHVPVLSRLRT